MSGRSRRFPARSQRLARRAVAVGVAVASALIAVGGCRSSAAPASASGVAVRNCLKQLACYSPQQFQEAYGIQPLLDRGINGRGETVALLEQEVTAEAASAKVTDIRRDLARFDSLFGLPMARLQLVISLVRSPSPWLADEEEVEDTEIVHGVAPEADIREILVNDADAASPAATVTYGLAALRLSVTQGAVISVSSGKCEYCFTPAEIDEQNATLQTARDYHVTVVISSGDSGVVSSPCPGAAVGSAPVAGVNLLGSDPLALAAGGTSLIVTEDMAPVASTGRRSLTRLGSKLLNLRDRSADAETIRSVAQRLTHLGTRTHARHQRRD